MANLNPQAAAKNWQRGMAGSGEKFKAGVQAVTESPMEKAALAVDRQVAGVQRAAMEGKTQARLRAVPLDSWKRDMLEKGAQRVAAGAAVAEPKVAAFFSEFFPFLQSGMAQLPPRGSLEENIARSAAMQRHNATFKRSR